MITRSQEWHWMYLPTVQTSSPATGQVREHGHHGTYGAKNVCL